MSDPLSILRDRIEKAESKVLRYKKSLESAESELSDLSTALRVMEGLANDSVASPPSSTTMGRQIAIVKLLGVGGNNGKPPAELYDMYCKVAAEDITIDTFRTTIWRMKEKTFDLDDSPWEVHGDDGKYWKIDARYSGLPEGYDPEEYDPTDEFEQMLAPQDQKENEPNNWKAVGSDAAPESVSGTQWGKASTPTWAR